MHWPLLHPCCPTQLLNPTKTHNQQHFHKQHQQLPLTNVEPINQFLYSTTTKLSKRQHHQLHTDMMNQNPLATCTHPTLGCTCFLLYCTWATTPYAYLLHTFINATHIVFQSLKKTLPYVHWCTMHMNPPFFALPTFYFQHTTKKPLTPTSILSPHLTNIWQLMSLATKPLDAHNPKPTHSNHVASNLLTLCLAPHTQQNLITILHCSKGA